MPNSGRVFALLADHLPFLISRFDRARRHLFVNHAVTEVVGTHDIIGKTNEELGMPADLVTRWNAAIDTALAGTPAEVTFEWTSSQGIRVFEGKVVPEPTEHGGIDTVLCITRDITPEVATRREREQLAALFAESPAAVSVVRGPEFRIEMLNPRAQTLWGRSDEILGMPLVEALPELVGQGFVELLRGVVATGTAYRGEEVPVHIVRPGSTEGQTHYFDFIYAPLRGLDGLVEGVIVHAHDVTDKVHARERMQLAIAATGVGIWEWNVVTNEVRWDRQMCEIYGVDAKDVSYETWRAAVLPEEIALQEAILMDTVRRCGRSTRSFRIKRFDDGRVRDIACVETVRVGASGGAEWVVGTNLDVTEQRTAERDLRVSEARFRAMADHVPQLAWMADRDGVLDWFNQRWLDFTGTTLADNVGDGWQHVHHPDHVDRVVAKFAHHLREGLDWEDTFPLRGRDGTYRWFLSRMTAIRGPAGDVVRFFGTNTDVTEQRELESDLRRMSTELSEADRRKDDFLATLAHELRNPLAPVRNGLAILRSTSAPEASAASRTFEIMDRQLSHLARLVDDLLDISRVRTGKITLARASVDMREIVDVAIETCRPSIDRLAHTIHVDAPSHPVVVDGDRTRLVQVVANLVNNAAKYSEAGGRIEVTVARDAGHAVVRVIDDGVGIAPDAIGTVWDLFTQIRDTLDKSQGGLGIGLALAEKLVALHGGTITVRSEGLGRGSTFEVRLPLAPDAPVALTPSAPSPAKLGRRRILIVDDNVDGAETLAMLLGNRGHDTRIAHSGRDALATLAQFSPELVFLDIGLPDIDGHEVARRIRAASTAAPVVLVALTGWGTPEDQRRSRDAGFDAHLTKPIAFAVIEDVLRRYP